MGLSIGSHVQVLPTLTFGVLASNVNAPQWTDEVELAQSLAVGVAYEAAPAFFVLLDAVKDIDFPLSVRGGLETQPLPPRAAGRIYHRPDAIHRRPRRTTRGADGRRGRRESSTAWVVTLSRIQRHMVSSTPPSFRRSTDTANRCSATSSACFGSDSSR